MKQSKFVFSVILFTLPLLLLYFYFLNYLDYFLAFIISILVSYLAYVLKVILEYILVSIFLGTKVNYLIIYPFTYDSKLLFNPVNLLYNYDGFQDSQYLNIDIELPINIKKRQYHLILFFSKLSLLCSLLLIGFFIYNLHSNDYIFIIMLIISFAWGCISFFKFTNFSYGADYFIKAYGIDTFLLQSNGYKDFHKQYFNNYFNNLNSLAHPAILLKILENYVYYLIYHDYMAKAEDIELIVKSLSKLEGYFYQEQFNPQFHTRYINIIKLVAILYNENMEHDKLMIIETLLRNYRNYLISQNVLELLDKPIESINFFLMNYTNKEEISHFIEDLIFDLRPIFHYQKEIESKTQK